VSARQIIAVLALIGLFLALYLTLYKVGVIGQLVCNIGSCETVNASRWAMFLGAPVAAWGACTYLVLLLLSIAGPTAPASRALTVSWLLVAVSGWSVAFSAWLTYLELFAIHAVCMWCLTSAAIMIAIFVASLADLRASRAEQA
jgi:uncharacterized membrane protein